MHVCDHVHARVYVHGRVYVRVFAAYSVPPVVSVNDVTGVAGERIEIVCRVLSDPPPTATQGVLVLSSGMVVGPISISFGSGTPRTTIFTFQILTANPALHAGPAVCRTRVTLDSGTEEVNGSFNIAVLVGEPLLKLFFSYIP